jgi:4-amino-4-deoxy-L-arabinose transferase-like glycosyltransferase
LQNAELICCGKNNYNEIDSRPPLLSLLFAGAFKVWHSDYAAYFVTAVLNALGPVVLYVAGRRFVGRRAAVIAALLLGFTPFMVSVFPVGFVSFPTGHSLLSDCPALTLIVAAFWLMLRGLEGDGVWEFGGAGVVLAMAVLMRFPSLASVGMVSLLVLAARRWGRAAVAVAGGFLVGMAPYLGWSRWRYGGWLATFRSGWDNFSGPGQPVWFYVRWSGVIFGWVAVVGVGLWGLRRVVEAWGRRGAGRPWTWSRVVASREGFLCLWAGVLLVVFSLLGHKEPRYVMPVAPPLYLLAGAGLSWLVVGRWRTVGVVVLVAVMGWEFWPVRERFATGFVDRGVSEEMRVAAFLNATEPPGTVLYMNLSYADFAHYTEFKVVALPEDGDDLAEAMRELPGGGVFVAYKRFEGSVPEPSIASLDGDGRFKRVREFEDLVVYEF